MNAGPTPSPPTKAPPSAPHPNPADAAPPSRTRPKSCDGIGLILQGGGALGAYQAGVYQALHEANLEPDWVAGVSIGGINAALIAGNPREKRLERLQEFWDTITGRDTATFWPDGDDPRKLRNFLSAMGALNLGQPGFFTPNPGNAWFSPRGAKTATSFYDSTPLRRTLQKLVDFDLLNSGAVRFAVGAVNVETANFAYFDNAKTTIGPEHVMASGALPPALPMIRIGPEYFWDGGLVSNTPLQHLLENCGAANMLVFQVDLFSAQGEIPRDMFDVLSRQKDIQYSSRTRMITDFFTNELRLKRHLRDVLAKLPESELTAEQKRLKLDVETQPTINIVQLIYKQKAYEGDAKDYEFSRLSMREHWRSGYHDTRNSLRHTEWLAMPKDEGVVSHDIHRTRAGD